ncbi:MAG: ATP-dependent 6-phosphofructokinase [Victivallaceae bacterium]|nr:ATP-dependent 6-phosphofructokinase [Victivallaceae bacterium]
MKRVGILTSGGDCPGLNALLCSVGKNLMRQGYDVLGFEDGFEGPAFDRCVQMTDNWFSGLLALGGTALRTSRCRPNKMTVDNRTVDMTSDIVENCRKHELECLIAIGGGGTHKGALMLQKAGLKLITLPKTIDNDLACTDSSIGFASALRVATGAIDSLHSTAGSHKRIMLVQIMGHRAGWLTLSAGLSGGADVILIPEMPYDIATVAEALSRRRNEGNLFSIIPVAEGALSIEEKKQYDALLDAKASSKGKAREAAKAALAKFDSECSQRLIRLSEELSARTGMDSRVTILGHLQRGGSPSSIDRLLAAELGRECAMAVLDHDYGKMIALQKGEYVRVPIEEVAGRRKLIPPDHRWVQSAIGMGVSFGVPEKS